jgi:hypothetical protein
VQVTDVLEAVPAQLEGEHTQPVDAGSTNPFASDEPTETALIEPSAAPAKLVAAARTPQELKATQPMRIVGDDEAADPVADTIPPSDEPARLEPPPAPGESTSEPATDGGASDAAGAPSEAKADSASDAKAGSASNAKGETEADANRATGAATRDSGGDAKLEARSHAAPDAGASTSGASSDSGGDVTADDTIDAPVEPHANGNDGKTSASDDAAPASEAAAGELAVTESGRTRVPRNGKDAG